MPKKAFSSKVRQYRLSKVTYRIFDITKKEQDFLVIILTVLLLSRLVVPYPRMSMWFGFFLSSYSAIANDSIQTIGTFIASNAQKKWWHLWLFMGGIFVGTIVYSWLVYGGDVSHQRLTVQGFAEAPQHITFFQLCAPIVLLILTRMRIPVSTTFLLLNIFTTETHAVWSIFQKSFLGYMIAFLVAVLVWYPTTLVTENRVKNPVRAGWSVMQWISSGLLWSVWITQDAANIAVFLPRKLALIELLLFIGWVFAGLGVLFYLRGDRMQQLVNEKVGIKDIRAATLVDLVYMGILYYFSCINRLPMSTTWVFIGLLGGRELAISLTQQNVEKRTRALQKSMRCIRNDFKHACVGLIVSILLALLVNPVIREAAYSLLNEMRTYITISPLPPSLIMT